MAFDRYKDGFDQCSPPFCIEDISVDITEWSCLASSKTFTVSWGIHDLYNRSFGFLNVNKVVWSCDDTSFDNSSVSTDASEPYRTSFDISNCDGIIHYKVQLRIEGTLFESEVHTFDTTLCVEGGIGEELSVVIARWCGCSSGGGIGPDYNLFVKESAIQFIPSSFFYDDFCWEITGNDEPIPENPPPSGIIIDDIGESYDNCEECCPRIDCPKAWTDDDDPNLEYGVFYFEYQTFDCPDNIFVVSNFDSDTDCQEFEPPSEKVLYNTGCTGTSSDNEGKGFIVNNPICEDMELSVTKGFCLRVYRYQLPIGIINQCNCDDGRSCSTAWNICMIDPDGVEINWSGGNECLCTDSPIKGEFMLWRTDEELTTAVDQFYLDNIDIFKDKTKEEIEEIILELVSNGDILADVAIEIATREGLDLE